MASRNSKGRMLYWKIAYNHKLNRCSILARLLYTWGLPNTDNLGRMEGDPAVVKGMVFPLDNKITIKMVEDALKELAREWLIFWYNAGGNMYMQYVSFHKYQNLQKNHSRESDYPPPPEELLKKYKEHCEKTCSNMYLDVYSEAEKKEEEECEISIPFKEIIDYLNAKAGTQYKHTSDATKKLIRARWGEGYRMEHFQQVIDVKVSEWINRDDMRQYLRPKTLFGPKFEDYVNQKRVSAKSSIGISALRGLYDEFGGDADDEARND